MSKSSTKPVVELNQVLELAQKLIDLEKNTSVKTDMLTFVPPCFFPDLMMYHRLTVHGCSASRDSVIISANGEVRRCALLPESYGNIREESLKIIWSRMLEFEKPTNSHCGICLPHEYCAGGCEARAIEYTACGDCNIRRICGGGCMADRLFSSDKPYYCEAYSDMYKYFGLKMPELKEKGLITQAMKNL